MSISYPPSTPPSGMNSTPTVLAALTTPQTFPPNPNRLSGLVSNFANKPAWLIFGPGVPIAGGQNCVIVPAAANGVAGVTDLPDDYDGPIGIVWSAGVATGGTNNAVLIEVIP